MKNNSKPLTSVIILNWNGETLLEECLSNLLSIDYTPLEIIVVDNASSDNSLRVLNKYCNKITIICNSSNLGYAAGNNVGIMQSKGKYIVTLNNDVIVDKNWLKEPLKLLESDPIIGIISCRQMQYYQRDLIDGLFHSVNIFLNFPPLGFNKPYTSFKKIAFPSKVISANGGSAIYRKTMLDEIGLLDEKFFAYCEEADLCFRAFCHGWNIVYVPSAIVYHKGGESFKKVKKQQLYYRERNRLWFIYKNLPFHLIFTRLPFLFLWELRIIRIFFLKLKSPLLYFKTRIDAFAGLKSYHSIRKKNLKLLAIRQNELNDLIKNKYIPL